MKTSILSETKHHLLEKGVVAATALSGFHFCNPSSVLAPFLPPSLIFKDLNLQYFARRPKLHLLILKQLEKKNLLRFRVLAKFRSDFSKPEANRKGNRRANRRSQEKNVCDRRKTGVRYKRGGQTIIFSNKNHLFENHEKMIRS